MGSSSPTGNVTGDLSHLPLTLTDSTPFNDLSQVFTFGSSLQFTLDLATTNPSPGATFTFTMYDASSNPVDAIGGGNFSAIEIDVDQFGNPGSPVLGPDVSAVPGPTSAVLLAVGGVCLAAYQRSRTRAARAA